MDDALRRAARSAAESGAPTDEAASLRMRLRAGERCALPCRVCCGGGCANQGLTVAGLSGAWDDPAPGTAVVVGPEACDGSGFAPLARGAALAGLLGHRAAADALALGPRTPVDHFDVLTWIYIGCPAAGSVAWWSGWGGYPRPAAVLAPSICPGPGDALVVAARVVIAAVRGTVYRADADAWYRAEVAAGEAWVSDGCVGPMPEFWRTTCDTILDPDDRASAADIWRHARDVWRRCAVRHAAATIPAICSWVLSPPPEEGCT